MLRTSMVTACAVVAVPALGAIETEFINLDFSGEPAFESFFFGNRDFDRDNLSIETLVSDVGGVNGDVLQVLHFHDPVDPGDPFFDDMGDTIQSFHLFEGATWDTAIDGEIVDVSFSIDISNSSDVEDVFFVMGDDNGGSAAGFMNVIPGTVDGFTTYTFNNVTQDQLPSRDFTDGQFQFGFGFISRSFDDQGAQFTAEADNFRVVIESIPAPATLTGIGGLLVIGTRRR